MTAIPARTLGEALRGCAEKYPRRTALVYQGSSLTYSGLLAAATARAAALRAKGATPGSRMAVYLDRRPDLVIWLVAAALAGATQLAIDPDDPPARVQRILADAAPRVVVTEPARVLTVMSQARYDVLLAGDHQDGSAGAAVMPCDPGEPAYMVYTSGSTGEPKASMISHAALLSRLDWLQRRYGLADDDRVLLKTACGFDVFIAELYWPLTAGATLVVAPPGGHRDPEYLAQAVLKEGVTTLHFVPTLLDLFLAGRDPDERYDGLRRVMAGGEPLPAELVQRFYARCPGTLHNLYGPSECAIYSTAWECPRDPDLSRVLIGEAVDGTELWVLGEDMRPAEPGTPGELFIGGVGVGNGYHARPALSAERFLTLTLNGSDRRVYRTGDLVRDTGAGQFEYLGRVDTQIKIRGYRVEPGEIEVTILRTGLVRAAAVVADTAGRVPRLVAFVVPSPPNSADTVVSALLAELRRELPAYLVPAAVAAVAALPLSPNGKVDRKELTQRAGDIKAAGSASEPDLPASPVAVLTTEMWKELLMVEQVGAEDDFFLLGGDSMAAIAMVRSLAAKVSLDIPARALFDAPTLGEFIDYVTELELMPRSGSQ